MKTMIRFVYAKLILVLFINAGMHIAYSESSFDEPGFPKEPSTPGWLAGTGTQFDITDSEYLNITLQSSREVSLVLESIPRTIMIRLEGASSVSDVSITISGLEPSRTYYKYTDSEPNPLEFTADTGGRYTFTQNIASPHLIFIQENVSTKYIPDDTAIGTWDPVTRIFTLTGDVYESVVISQDDLTLDGAGHAIIGTGSDRGIFLNGRSGVTVKNLEIRGFSYGVYINASHGNTLSDIAAHSNRHGIVNYSSNNNTFTGNTSYSNDYYGIYVRFSIGNILEDNTMSGNAHGIYMVYSGGTTLTGNSMSSHSDYNFLVFGFSTSDFDNDIDISNTIDGKPIYYVKNGLGEIYDNTTNAGVFYGINCEGITVKDLNLSKNWAGIFLWETHNSDFENVIVQNNNYGIYLSYSNGNRLTGNSAINNLEGIFLTSSKGNQLTGNNTGSNGNSGIYLSAASNGNELIESDASNNSYGIHIANSDSNLVRENTLDNNTLAGINLYYSNENTLRGNTISSSGYYGLRFSYSNSNYIYNNHFIDNLVQAYGSYSSGNIFSLDRPISGNYWDNWTTPDANGDGYVDQPYVFYGGIDSLPLAAPGAANQASTAPVVDITPDVAYPHHDLVCTIVTPSVDPDGDSITYTFAWYKDGVMQDNLITDTVPSDSTAAGEVWKCVVTPSDGQADGPSAEDEVEIQVPPYAYYSVFATNSGWLKHKSEVHSGNVGVNDVAEDRGRKHHKRRYELVIDQRASTPAGYDVKANRVRIERKAVVGGDIYYNKLRNRRGRVEGDEYTPLELPVLDPLPEFETGAPGDDNIYVRRRETRSLEPGDYGDVVVRQRGTLIFTGGVYNLKSLKAGDRTKLLFQGPSQVRVAGRFDTDQRSYVGPDDGSGYDASDIIFYVAGTDGRRGRRHSNPRAASIGIRNEVLANFYVPNGSLDLQLGTRATGSFFGKDVNVGIGVEVSLLSYWGDGSEAEPDGAPLARPLAANPPEAVSADGERGVSRQFTLSQNFPNPFNPETVIRYQLPAGETVRLIVYNIRGQEVKSLVDGQQAAGDHSVRWDGTDNRGRQVASGVYFYRLKAGSFSAMKKMTLLQ